MPLRRSMGRIKDRERHTLLERMMILPIALHQKKKRKQISA